MNRSHIFARRVLAAASLLSALCVFAPVAAAQTAAPAWPQRSVKFILPFGAGSATDVAARLMSDKLAVRWGKPVVIENKPGGDGLVAITAFVSGPTTTCCSMPRAPRSMRIPTCTRSCLTICNAILLPIARVTDTILSASVPATLKAKTVAEFVALARAEPNTLNAAGAAGVPEFTLGYFLKVHDLAVAKVPYRDIVQAATHLAAGQIQFLLSSAAIVRSLTEAGKIRMLAVTSRARVPFAPDVPTIYEAGFPALAVETTAGLYGPGNMARELRERLAKDVIAVVSDPAITEKLVATGQAVNPGGPDELAQTLKQQAEQMATVAKALGLKAGK